MLRRIIKAVIPSKGDIFFNLFVKASDNVYETANLLADVINNENKIKFEKLKKVLKEQRKKAVDINTLIELELNSQFFTPIDRGDIQEISSAMLQLTKKIIKIYKKLQVYEIDAKTDDCLIRSVNSLQKLTKSLNLIIISLKEDDHETIRIESKKADELDDNVLDDLGHTMKVISDANYDALTIIKLKEVYKAIESGIDTSANLCDLVSSVSVKAI